MDPYNLPQAIITVSIKSRRWISSGGHFIEA